MAVGKRHEAFDADRTFARVGLVVQIRTLADTRAALALAGARFGQAARGGVGHGRAALAGVAAVVGAGVAVVAACRTLRRRRHVGGDLGIGIGSGIGDVGGIGSVGGIGRVDGIGGIHGFRGVDGSIDEGGVLADRCGAIGIGGASFGRRGAVAERGSVSVLEVAEARRQDGRRRGRTGGGERQHSHQAARQGETEHGHTLGTRRQALPESMANPFAPRSGQLLEIKQVRRGSDPPGRGVLPAARWRYKGKSTAGRARSLRFLCAGREGPALPAFATRR